MTCSFAEPLVVAQNRVTAIRSLRAGGNVIAVQKLLGHASVATTQRYLDHLALGELRAAVPPLPVRNS